jgi:hypothetical protein
MCEHATEGSARVATFADRFILTRDAFKRSKELQATAVNPHAREEVENDHAAEFRATQTLERDFEDDDSSPTGELNIQLFEAQNLIRTNP